MKHYRGAVFFVDILGISALTRGRIPLVEQDYEAHSLVKSNDRNGHFLSAKLLVTLRAILKEIKNPESDINVAQLSDCAFVWSSNPMPLIDAAIACMWAAVSKGLLCRGGIAFGDIIEPDSVNIRLGEFILGEAVTKAVDRERAGKGCRIFSDNDLPSEVSGAKHFSFEPFVGNKNPNDCSVTDELRWFLFPDGVSKHDHAQVDRRQTLSRLMEAIAALRFSPKFRWNASTPDGALHLASSVDTISSGVRALTDELDYQMEARSLISSLQSNRSAEAEAHAFARWRQEIGASLTK
jgi:hypothetical protein